MKDDVSVEQGEGSIPSSLVIRVLYITYNGLLEPIGQAQVLQYLERVGVDVKLTVLSFEKQTDWHDKRHRQTIAGRLTAAGIDWRPELFHHRPPVLSKWRDLRALEKHAGSLADEIKPDLIHCRSYVATDAGRRVARRRGLPYIFDMRGFWVDERREGGRWDTRRWFFRQLYRHWKRKEASCIRDASEIVVLTERAHRIVKAHAAYDGQPISVIPCCVDHDYFDRSDRVTVANTRRELGVQDDAYGVVYLGSIGTVYRFDDMLRAFAVIRRHRRRSRLLLIGRHDPDVLEAAIERVPGVEMDDVVFCRASHREVARYLGAADLALAFRAANYSGQGASPTKLAEYFACGLPVIVNDGVGDVGEIVKRVDGGLVLDASLDEAAIESIANCLDALDSIDRHCLRERSRSMHDLPVASIRYDRIYRRLAKI